MHPRVFFALFAIVFALPALAADLRLVRSNTFNFPFTDAVFDAVRGRVYGINAAANKVVGVRLSDGVADQEFTFSRMPETLAIRPDGKFLYAAMPTQQHSSYWFDAHTGYVGEVNLETATKTREWEVDVDPYDILATDDGWIILPDGSGQWTTVGIFKAGSSTRSGTGSIRQASRATLHPSQSRFYTADTDVGPSDIKSWRFDTATGAISSGTDSPYHGDYPMGGNVFAHANGTNLVTAGGALYTSSSTAENDMKYVRTLAGGSVRAVHFDMEHKAMFTAGGGPSWENLSPKLTWYGATYEPIGEWTFADSITQISSGPNELYLVFVRPDRTLLNVYDNPATGAETNAAPVAAFTSSPEAPTTLTTIQLDASSSTDDGGTNNLMYRWDFEADGAWNVAYSSNPKTEVRYNVGGTKTIRLEVMDRYGVATRIEKTINVPFEADPGQPGGTNVAFTIPFAPTDLAVDLGRLHLFATDSAGKKLVVLNLTTGFIERELTFEHMPENMAVTPDGSNLYVAQILRHHSPYWFSAHTGYVAQFDLATLRKIREVRVDIDPWGIVANDKGILGISGGSDQWTEIGLFEGATGQKVSAVGSYMMAPISLHPDQNAIYSGSGLSPADHGRISFNRDTGAGATAWDSPYHGDHPIGGKPFPTPDGRYIVSQGGAVLSSSPSQASDLRYIRTLEGGGFTSLAFDPANEAMFTVGGAWGQPGALRYYNANFELVRSEPLTNEISRVFASAEKLWLVGRKDNATVVFVRDNPAAGATTNLPPVAAFSYTPTAPTTLDYVQFDANASRDENKPELLYRWDWQADGTYDTPFTNSPTAQFRFISTGEQRVRLQVKDAFGELATVERTFTVTAGFDTGTAITHTGDLFKLPFVPKDAAFDALRPRLYALDEAGKRLVVVNLETGGMEREFRFDFTPDAITITPNGAKMYVTMLGSGHDYYTGGQPHFGFVAEFTLDPLGKTREMQLPIDPADIVATDAGHLVISDGSDQWTEMAVFDAATGQKLGSGGTYMGMRLVLHPNQRIVYGTDVGLSPADIRHYDISSAGAVSGGWDSPYHGDYALGGEVFIFPDASGVFSPAGVVLSSSATQNFDLRYLRTMPFGQIADVAFDAERKIMAAATGASVTFYDYSSNKVVATRALAGNALFVGMREGRAAVLAATGNGSTISFLRIPAATLEENLPPTITLSAPTNGGVVAVGLPLDVKFTAADEDGDVASVRIFSGTNELVFTPLLGSAHGSVTLTTAGAHAITAVATDNFNVASTSVVATVTATLPPTVSITEPLNDQVFSSPEAVRIRVNASDADGSIARVYLYDNGNLLREFTAAPYTFDLMPTESGIHNIYAEAVDNLGVATTSEPVRFVIGGFGTDTLTRQIVALGGLTQTLYGSTANATRQKFEPLHAGNGGGKSIWWAWRAPESGTVMISTAGSNFDTLLGVYTWGPTNTLETMSVVASNDDDVSAPPTSRVKFTATKNTLYYIAVDGRDGVGGTVVLNISQYDTFTGPVNDNFASALTLQANVTNNTSNVGATLEPGEAQHGGVPGGASVWWTFRAFTSNPIEISTEGSNFDTVLAVYTLSAGTLRPLVSNDDAGPTQTWSRVTVQANSPTIVYYVAVDGYNGATGNIRLRMRNATALPQPTPNDNFAAATVISGTAYVANVSSLGATRQAGEPIHAGQTGGRSLWWTWTAPASGIVSISTRTSAIDTLLGVYTGATVGGLTAVASNDDDPMGGRTSAVYFQAVEGTRYHIAVDGYNGTGGAIVLSLNQTANVAPRVLAAMNGGNLELSASGTAGSVIVERSIDLVNWEPVETLQTGASMSIQMQADPNGRAAFFRARVQP